VPGAVTPPGRTLTPGMGRPSPRAGAAQITIAKAAIAGSINLALIRM
jgi:hypothetical protein